MKKVEKCSVVFFSIISILAVGFYFGHYHLRNDNTNNSGEELIEGSSSIPTKMTVGDRTYDILSVAEKSQTPVGHSVIKQIKKMNAHLGKEDAQYLLRHQLDIPTVLQGKVNFIFTDYRFDGDFNDVCCVTWNSHHQKWIYFRFSLNHLWVYPDKVLRRK